MNFHFTYLSCLAEIFLSYSDDLQQPKINQKNKHKRIILLFLILPKTVYPCIFKKRDLKRALHFIFCIISLKAIPNMLQLKQNAWILTKVQHMSSFLSYLIALCPQNLGIQRFFKPVFCFLFFHRVCVFFLTLIASVWSIFSSCDMFCHSSEQDYFYI